MRVTKYIKDYVTEEVSRIYNAKKNPYTDLVKDFNDTVDAFIDALNEEIEKKISAFVAESGAVGWNGEEYLLGRRKFVSYNTFYSPYSKLSNQWNQDNAKAREDKIREILISLELGETSKSELTNLIANLTAE